MKREERAKMILAMEYIARQINSETIFEGWLMSGVPDGELKYGETNPEVVDEFHLEDENFRDLMEVFLRCMRRAENRGGLYCDGVVTRDEEVK